MSIRKAVLGIIIVPALLAAGCGAVSGSKSSTGTEQQAPASKQDFIAPASGWLKMSMPSKAKVEYRLVTITTASGTQCGLQSDLSNGTQVTVTLLHNGGC